MICSIITLFVSIFALFTVGILFPEKKSIMYPLLLTLNSAATIISILCLVGII